MYEKLKKFLEFSSKKGLYLPSAYDSSRNEPSTTLLSFYVGLILSVASLIAYHFLPETLVGPTSMTLLFLGMTFIFYRLRNLDKVKFDIKNQTFELEDEPEQINKKEE
jgi:cbb3-type cytochrome oxidase subunit 3